ncbi:hypothetical protein GCM10028784_24270 [Myceligenerans cantabricum]
MARTPGWRAERRRREPFRPEPGSDEGRRQRGSAATWRSVIAILHVTRLTRGPARRDRGQPAMRSAGLQARFRAGAPGQTVPDSSIGPGDDG